MTGTICHLAIFTVVKTEIPISNLSSHVPLIEEVILIHTRKAAALLIGQAREEVPIHKIKARDIAYEDRAARCSQV